MGTNYVTLPEPGVFSLENFISFIDQIRHTQHTYKYGHIERI